MTFNAAVEAIMPLVESGNKDIPFIISKRNGEYEIDYLSVKPEKFQEALKYIREHDSFAVMLTGHDLAKGSFPYVYDRILNERLRAEYEHAPVKDANPRELHALMNLMEENIGEFSSEVTDYLTIYDKPLAALYDMTPISLISGNPDFDYDYDKVEDFVDAVENHINDLLNNRKKQEIPKEIEGSEQSDKRIIEGYEEKLCVQLAGKFVVLAENPKDADPYFVCNIKYDNPLGFEERYDGAVTNDYLEAMREFITRVDSLLGTLEAERTESGLPIQTLTAAECIKGSQNADWEGKLIIIKPEILTPELRDLNNRTPD